MIWLCAHASWLRWFAWADRLAAEGAQRVVGGLFVLGAPNDTDNGVDDVVRETQRARSLLPPPFVVVPGWSNIWYGDEEVGPAGWFNSATWSYVRSVLVDLAARCPAGTVALDVESPMTWSPRYPALFDQSKLAKAMRPLWRNLSVPLCLFPDHRNFPAYAHTLLAPRGTVLCDESRYGQPMGPDENSARLLRECYGYGYLPGRYGDWLRDRMLMATDTAFVYLRPDEDDARNAFLPAWYTVPVTGG